MLDNNVNSKTDQPITENSNANKLAELPWVWGFSRVWESDEMRNVINSRGLMKILW